MTARIETSKKSRKIHRDIIKKRVCSIDFETTGISPYRGSEIFSYCIGDYNTGDVIVKRLDNKDNEENDRNFQYLCDFFEDTNIVKIAHNFKFELSFALQANIHIPTSTVWHDTMILSQMLDNLLPRHDLASLCERYGDYSIEMNQKKYNSVELDKYVSSIAKALGNNYQKIPKNIMNIYQKADGERPLLLYHVFLPEIKKDKRMYSDYLNEIELIKVTQCMESYGIDLDKRNINNLISFLESEIENTRDEIFEEYREFINLNSDIQVARLLYKKLQLPIVKFTESGRASTDKDTLFELRSRYKFKIFDQIIKTRSYTDALSTIKSYIKYGGEEGRIYPNINTNRARTSRQSSSSPNLQNVSKESAEKNLFPVPLRKCFRARPKHILLLVDYSGIEMRLIIDATREKELYDMLLKNPEADMHHPTLECFLGSKEAQALKENDYKEYKIKRGAFKNTGFCIAYGGGTAKVAYTLGKSYEEIAVGDANYRRRFPRINTFSQKMINEVYRNGYITTSFGRKLDIPIDKPYIASNYLIQGTAAGILKRAQVRLDKFFKSEYNNHIRQVLPIHDEIIISMPRNLLSELDTVISESSNIMVDMPEISIPLRVEWKMTTTDWNSAKELDTDIVYR